MHSRQQTDFQKFQKLVYHINEKNKDYVEKYGKDIEDNNSALLVDDKRYKIMGKNEFDLFIKLMSPMMIDVRKTESNQAALLKDVFNTPNTHICLQNLNNDIDKNPEWYGLLENFSTPDMLPYLLLRLNDWVPQVQSKAKDILLKILPSMSMSYLINHYKLIEWLGVAKRAKLTGMQNSIFKRISNNKEREELLDVMTKFFNSYEEYKACYRHAMFDDSKPIRDYARFVMTSQGAEDIADNYRQQLQIVKNHVDVGIVAGLAETGTKEDIPLIKPFFTHARANIRRAALLGLNRLADNNIEEYLLLGLQDESEKVRSACVHILQVDYHALRPKIRDLLENNPVKIKTSALKVLTHYGVLDSLQDILFALTQSCEILQCMAWQYFMEWHRQYSSNLWFSFNDETYHHTLHLLNTLKQANIRPPEYACNAWDDVPSRWACAIG